MVGVPPPLPLSSEIKNKTLLDEGCSVTDESDREGRTKREGGVGMVSFGRGAFAVA